MSPISKTDMTVVAQVAAHVKDMIVRQRLKRGAALPSYREIASDLGVAYTSVKFAMDTLATQGIVRRQRACGCYVNKELSRTGRPLRKIGIICTGSRKYLFSSPYLTQIMQGIVGDPFACPDLHIFSLREDGFVSPAQIAEHAVDGVILLGVENDGLLREFLTWETPGVVVDYCTKNIPLDFVACDNRAAARQAVAHLAGLGHRRVAFVAGSPSKLLRRLGNRPAATPLKFESSDMRERCDESLRALHAHGIQAESFILDAPLDWATVAADELHRRMRAAIPPTALLTDSNYAASPLINELARRGLRVPEDISVCAVASDSIPSFGGRSLTTSRINFVGMGNEARALLAARCRKPGLRKPRIHRIGFDFVEGQTTRKLQPGEKT